MDIYIICRENCRENEMSERGVVICMCMYRYIYI